MHAKIQFGPYLHGYLFRTRFLCLPCSSYFIKIKTAASSQFFISSLQRERDKRKIKKKKISLETCKNKMKPAIKRQKPKDLTS